jgi:hypothetical protein
MDSGNEVNRDSLVKEPRWGGFVNRLRGLVERKWPVALFRLLNAIVLLALGTMLEHSSVATAVVAILSYAVTFGVIEYGLAETSKDIERRVKEAAQQQNQRLSMDLETYAAAELFLSARLRRNTEVVSILQSGDPELIRIATQSSGKLPSINGTLRDLCETLSAICSKNLMIPRPEAWFRATYMEVQGPPNDEKLVYIGWHTLDGSPPRSMSLGVTYRKGEGCAGLAWERNRPVIEDDFRDRHEWKENYPKQGTYYKSMICAPVLKGYGSDMGSVIGVITVDTHLDRYFGRKDDRAQEDKGASMIRPYGTYIAFISAVDSAVRDLIGRLGTGARQAELSTHSELAITVQSDPDGNR